MPSLDLTGKSGGRDYPAGVSDTRDGPLAASAPGSPMGGGHTHPIPLPSALRARRRPISTEETSAGGLVINEDTLPAQAALIGRLDRRGRLMWSLPKGHLEAGETAEQAAIREVREETGIQGVIVEPLGTIDFWFVAEGRRIHKTVHHFVMRATGGSINADDPEVATVEWFPLDRIESLLAYADERRLMLRLPSLRANEE